MIAVALTAITGRATLSIRLTAVAFTLLKTWPPVAAWAAPILGGVTRTDPTDVIALLALIHLSPLVTARSLITRGRLPMARRSDTRPVHHHRNGLRIGSADQRALVGRWAPLRHEHIEIQPTDIDQRRWRPHLGPERSEVLRSPSCPAYRSVRERHVLSCLSRRRYRPEDRPGGMDAHPSLQRRAEEAPTHQHLNRRMFGRRKAAGLLRQSRSDKSTRRSPCHSEHGSRFAAPLSRRSLVTTQGGIHV